MKGTKIAIMIVAGLIPVMVIAGLTDTYIRSRKTAMTYMSEVVEGGFLEKTASEMVSGYRENRKDDNIDYDKFENDLSICLRTDVDSWLRSNDPRLSMTITDALVKELASDFVQGCLSKLTAD